MTIVLTIAFLLWMLAAPSVLGLELGAYDIGNRIGRFCGAILVGSLLGLIGFYAARRSSLVFNIALCIIIALNLFGIGMKDYRLSVRRGNDRALAKVDAIARQSRERDLEELESTGTIAADTSRIEDRLKQLEAATKDVKGSEKDLVAGAIEASRTLIEPLDRYNRAFTSLQDAGGIDPSTMDSKEKIAERITLINAFQTANEELAKAVAAAPEQLRASLANKGHPKARIDQAVSGYRRESQVDLTLKIRDTDRELCKTCLSILELLTESWGHWQYDQEDEQTLFEEDEHIARFNQLHEEMTKIAERQATLQRQALSGH